MCKRDNEKKQKGKRETTEEPSPRSTTIDFGDTAFDVKDHDKDKDKDNNNDKNNNNNARKEIVGTSMTTTMTSTATTTIDAHTESIHDKKNIDDDVGDGGGGGESKINVDPKTWQRVKDKVTSMIEDELQCVTTQSICQKFDGTLTRKQASDLLQEILTVKKQHTRKYNVNVCHQVKLGNATVFRLQTSKNVASLNAITHQEKPEQKSTSTIVALSSAKATESVSTAHERDMVELREMVSNESFNADPENLTILPGDGLQKMESVPRNQPTDLLSSNKTIPPKRTTGSSSSSTGTTRKMGTNSTAKPEKAKVMTAASFFAAHKKKGSTTTTTSGKNSPTNCTKSASGPSRKLFPSKVAPTEKDKETPKPIVTSRKGNSIKNVGNADDFVADEEESDDEEEDVKRRQAAAAAVERKNQARQARKKQQKHDREVIDLDDDDGEPSPDGGAAEDAAAPPSPVRGAMDAFATRSTSNDNNENNNKNNNGKQRRRRKRLVDVTTKVNGYLQTETQAVWEDVPSDEEREHDEERSKGSPKKRQKVNDNNNNSINSNNKKSNSSSNRGGNNNGKKKNGSQQQQPMKQKTLMGFFQKK